MKTIIKKIILAAAISALTSVPSLSWALASNNIPLDSPIYLYLEKLAGFGLVKSDIKGIRPFSRAEAARLVLEAEQNLKTLDGKPLSFAEEIIGRMRELMPRELSLYGKPEEAPRFDYDPFSSARISYVYLDGVPRDYNRPVNDPGDDGVFGIGSGLRPKNPYPSPVQQRGTEGTPFYENNEGIRYRRGNNAEFRFSGELYGGSYASALVEPLILYSGQGDLLQGMLNKGYLKLGGGGLELEVGRDSNWLGAGCRTAMILSSNARNFDLVKLSSPEPVKAEWVKRYLGELKYSLILSQFDRTFTDGEERKPIFLGAKLSVKPVEILEVGINLGRQVGGPGVDNDFGSTLRGLVGGMGNDNSNSVAGIELRLRLPYLRDSEIYGEYSGEDCAAFWPIVESYVAGFYIPRITADGRNDFRFEYYWGNAILSTNGTFPEGYLYRGMNIGPSQGGASQEFYARFSHWFSVRHTAALEYMHSERGNGGRVTVDAAGDFDPNGTLQAKERRDAARVRWSLPLYGDITANIMCGWEKISNVDLVAGDDRTNQTVAVDVSYRY
jgi:hypothetical protein